MVLSVLEAVPVSSKPPAVDDGTRTFTGERCGFGASAPSLTSASPIHFPGAKRCSAILLKLVQRVGVFQLG